MKCPLCGGGFENVPLKLVSATTEYAKRCGECGGWWLERTLGEPLDLLSVTAVDVAAPNYSLKHLDLVCPNDQSLLEEADNDDLPAGSHLWRCPDCSGQFYAKGSLGLITQTQQILTPSLNRSRAVLFVPLIVVGIIAVNAAIRKTELSLSAVGGQVLPTSGPNFLTLSLLALTYLAGTTLAVLGRRLPIVLMGWSVIAICLVGFTVVIFGP